MESTGEWSEVEPRSETAARYRRSPRTVVRRVRDGVVVGRPGSSVMWLEGSVAVVFDRLAAPSTVEQLVTDLAASETGPERPTLHAAADNPGAAIHDRVEDAISRLIEAGLVAGDSEHGLTTPEH